MGSALVARALNAKNESYTSSSHSVNLNGNGDRKIVVKIIFILFE